MSIISEKRFDHHFNCYYEYSISEEDGIKHHSERDFKITSNGTLTTYLGSEEHVLIPESVRIIGAKAFENKKIKSVTIPYTTKEIGEKAFYNCEQLLSVVFLEGVGGVGCQRIGASAFSAPAQEHVPLRYFALPQSLLYIGPHAFSIDKLNPLIQNFPVPHTVKFSYTPTEVIIKHCVRERLLYSMNVLFPPTLNYERAVLLRAIEQEKLIYRDPKTQKLISVSGWREWIKTLEKFLEKDEKDLRDLENQKYAKEAELHSLTGIFKAAERKRCQKEIDKLNSAIQYQLRFHNPQDTKANIDRNRAELDAFLHQPEEVLLERARVYYLHQLTDWIDRFRKEAVAEESAEQARKEAAYSASNSYSYDPSGSYGYTSSTSDPLLNHGPYGWATNCGMRTTDVSDLLGYDPPTMGDLGLSDPPISDM